MKRKKSERTKLIEKADKLWSLCVRTRDDFTCQKCGKKEKHTQGAHIFSRNHFQTRWDPANGITMCYYCHIMWSHREPIEFTQWIMEKLGRSKFRSLEEKSKPKEQITELFIQSRIISLQSFLNHIQKSESPF